jgi:MSHA biogenesis protein MshN
MIVFEHTNPIATLPAINYMSSAVKDMRMVTEENGDLKILLTLAAGTKLDTLQLNNEGKLPELQVNLSTSEGFYSSSAEVSLQDAAVMKEQTGSIKKIMLDMSLGEKYQEAINIAAQGNVKKSIQLLTEMTTTHPDFFQGRLSLASLLFEQGNTLRAQQLLEVGLQQRPLDPSYIELKARILISQGKSDSALKLLETVSPPLETHSDYHALVAALYQRLGQPQLAAQLYEQLLTLQPDNAVWWMGLGIALENSGKQSQALMAYSKADNSGSLNPELKIYIENRMHNLS